MTKTPAALEAEKQEGRGQIFGKSVKIEQRLEDLEAGERPQVIRTVLPFQLKSLNDQDRTIRFVGSTAHQDRYGDTIVQSGWDLAAFLKNPVIPWGHNYSEPPVATATEALIEHGDLTFTGKFPTIAELSSDPDHPSEYALFADAIYNAYRGGYLRAFSVGFIPLEYDGNWETGYTFTKCELLEVSCVTVPANSNALVLAFEEGVISDMQRKALITQSRSLIKSLTLDGESADNEDMQTAEAIKDLTNAVKELQETVAELKAAAPTTTPKTEEDNPEDKPSGGAPAVDLSDPEVQAAIKEGVKSALHQLTGKIE